MVHCFPSRLPLVFVGLGKRLLSVPSFEYGHSNGVDSLAKFVGTPVAGYRVFGGVSCVALDLV